MWINRRAFDALLAAHEREVAGLREARAVIVASAQREVQGLREEVAALRHMLLAAQDHNRRMARVDRSLTELEPRRKEPTPDEHMPASVQRLVALYDTSQAREIIAQGISAARGKGDSWPDIEARMKAELPEALIRKLEAANG